MGVEEPRRESVSTPLGTMFPSRLIQHPWVRMNLIPTNGLNSKHCITDFNSSMNSPLLSPMCTRIPNIPWIVCNAGLHDGSETIGRRQMENRSYIKTF
jgi:hypothetical protein